MRRPFWRRPTYKVFRSRAASSGELARPTYKVFPSRVASSGELARPTYKVFPSRAASSGGVTLIELTIVMGILIVLVCLLAAIWSSAYSIFRRGTSRMAATQQAREVVRRVTPLIMCAKAQSEITEAVLTPAIDTEDVRIDYTTADNILVPIQPVDGRNPTHYRFEIYQAADKTVRIRELNLTSGAPTGAEKILAYRIKEIHFKRLAANLVDFRAITSETIRNAVNQEEELKVERSAVIAIPYYSSTR